MEIIDITKFVTLVLAISLASERLVTIFKTLLPWLASPPNPAQPVELSSETTRRVIVLLLAILCSWFTSAIINGWHPWFVTITGVVKSASTILLGFLASAGSSFWSSILGYTKAVKDIKTQKLLQESLHTNSLLASIKK
ncbi:hypothetical protein HDF24_18945 [Mucilaginibacter sp. X4EP1]|uniref:hypothetical protein n=1 Tax=Mucilaginibacter sp. X4EP1 TaxID=2723092 RepID=UPI0021670DC7|nr:hypothetical protein [Mucilaginibacter sp. X4EP1]MCS3813349.1 hypothetical protein [Mucilaginibacter sp. X4EP1]